VLRLIGTGISPRRKAGSETSETSQTGVGARESRSHHISSLTIFSDCETGETPDGTGTRPGESHVSAQLQRSAPQDVEAVRALVIVRGLRPVARESTTLIGSAPALIAANCRRRHAKGASVATTEERGARGGSGNAGNAGNPAGSPNGVAAAGGSKSTASPDKSRESQGRWDRLVIDGIGIAGLRVPESQNHT
jgi:hypothetical protein